MSDEFIVPPPSSLDVQDRRPVVYDAYGAAYKRAIGFRIVDRPGVMRHAPKDAPKPGEAVS